MLCWSSELGLLQVQTVAAFTVNPLLLNLTEGITYAISEGAVSTYFLPKEDFGLWQVFNHSASER